MKMKAYLYGFLAWLPSCWLMHNIIVLGYQTLAAHYLGGLFTLALIASVRGFFACRVWLAKALFALSSGVNLLVVLYLLRQIYDYAVKNGFVY